jgi:hypothetical protein
MARQAGHSNNSCKPAPYVMLMLAGAVLLIALGFLIQQRWPVSSQQDVRLTMLCVSGFSWERVMPLHQQGRLPYLASLFNRGCSYGDIVSPNFASDAAITATLFTGLLPKAHEIYEPKDFLKLTPDSRLQIAIWHELAVQGKQCVVVGFPSAAGAYGCSQRLVFPQEEPHTIEGADIEKYVQDISERRALPPRLIQFLRECIGSDAERIRRAVDATAACKPAHLFVYFEGLGRWQKRLSDNSDSLSESLRSELIDNYYKYFDTLLAKLQERLGEQDAFFLLSERGNLHGCPSYWKDFPLLKECPATGFFYATGRHIREGTEPVFIKPADIVPTLVYLAGNPVPNTMNGIVNFNMLEDEFYFQHKLSYR